MTEGEVSFRVQVQNLEVDKADFDDALYNNNVLRFIMCVDGRHKPIVHKECCGTIRTNLANVLKRRKQQGEDVDAIEIKVMALNGDVDVDCRRGCSRKRDRPTKVCDANADRKINLSHSITVDTETTTTTRTKLMSRQIVDLFDRNVAKPVRYHLACDGVWKRCDQCGNHLIVYTSMFSKDGDGKVWGDEIVLKCLKCNRLTYTNWCFVTRVVVVSREDPRSPLEDVDVE
jgi:hypothetical protein